MSVLLRVNFIIILLSSIFPFQSLKADIPIKEENYIVFLQDMLPFVHPFQTGEKEKDLGLGAWSPTFFIQLYHSLPAKNASLEVKIEKHLTIMGEGPHIDLRELASMSTPWLKLTRRSFSTWEAPLIDETSYTNKETPTLQEVLLEVKRLLKEYGTEDDYWLKKAKDCVPPYEGDCIWAESKLHLRITQLVNGKKIHKPLMSFIIPMGC